MPLVAFVEFPLRKKDVSSSTKLPAFSNTVLAADIPAKTLSTTMAWQLLNCPPPQTSASEIPLTLSPNMCTSHTPATLSNTTQSKCECRAHLHQPRQQRGGLEWAGNQTLRLPCLTPTPGGNLVCIQTFRVLCLLHRQPLDCGTPLQCHSTSQAVSFHEAQENISWLAGDHGGHLAWLALDRGNLVSVLRLLPRPGAVSARTDEPPRRRAS